jgi:hypothetical protein
MVSITCNGDIVGAHERCWANRITITDPAHVQTAKTLRHVFAIERSARGKAIRYHPDGNRVMLRTALELARR